MLSMACLLLCHNVGVVRLRYLAQHLGLFAWYIDGAFPGELHMIEIEYFIVELLQCPLLGRKKEEGTCQDISY